MCFDQQALHEKIDLSNLSNFLFPDQSANTQTFMILKISYLVLFLYFANFPYPVSSNFINALISPFTSPPYIIL